MNDIGNFTLLWTYTQVHFTSKSTVTVVHVADSDQLSRSVLIHCEIGTALEATRHSDGSYGQGVPTCNFARRIGYLPSEVLCHTLSPRETLGKTHLFTATMRHGGCVWL
jgi:hypothetical protein